MGRNGSSFACALEICAMVGQFYIEVAGMSPKFQRVEKLYFIETPLIISYFVQKPALVHFPFR